MSFGSLPFRQTALIEVIDENGAVGYGESWINYPPWAGAERVATVQQGVAPLLIGEEVHNVRDVQAVTGMLQSKLAGFARQWGAIGPITQAISGVDIALWDLLGRTAGLSIAELLGGRVRDTVPVYASGLDATNISELTPYAMSEGFRAIKCRLGFGPQDVDTVSRAAAYLDGHCSLYGDANQAWTLSEATETLQAIKSFGLGWIEEPLTGNNLSEIEDLVRRTAIPVAVGENLYGIPAYASFARSSAVAVLQPDVSKVGGIGAVAEICELGRTLEKPIVPHWYGGAITLAATLQLAAVFPVIEQVEYDIRENPLRDSLIEQPFKVVAGMLAIPGGPGLGVDIDGSSAESFETLTEAVAATRHAGE